MLHQKDFETIDHMLKRKGLRAKQAREELVDHFSTEIESHIALGAEKDLAINYVMRELNYLDLKKINRNAILLKIKKPLIMTTLIAFVASLLLFTNTSVEQSKQAISPKNETMQAEFVAINSSLDEPPYLWPINTDNRKITAGYGDMRSPFSQKIQDHKGVDIRAKSGTPISAPSPAEVIEVGKGQKKGNYIILKHDHIFETKYFHLSEILVKEGQQLEAGEVIGKVGSTGLSTGPHLHYEVLKNGQNVDPKEYLKRT